MIMWWRWRPKNNRVQAQLEKDWKRNPEIEIVVCNSLEEQHKSPQRRKQNVQYLTNVFTGFLNFNKNCSRNPPLKKSYIYILYIFI